MPSPTGKVQGRTSERVALSVVAVMLGTLVLFFQRLLAGSWRGFAAVVAAVAVVYGGVIAIDRALQRQGVPPEAIAPPWALIAVTGVGAAAGVAYGLVAPGHPVWRGAANGALIAGVLALLGGVRRARAGKRPAPPAA